MYRRCAERKVVTLVLLGEVIVPEKKLKGSLQSVIQNNYRTDCRRR
jgi:hypothetical protein